MREEQVLAKVRAYRKRQPECGGRKIQRMLANDGLDVGRDWLFDLLRDHGLLLKRKRRQKPSTTPGNGTENLVGKNKPTEPNEILVADITYIRAGARWVYLAIVTCMYSRKILGYDLSSSLEPASSVKALKMAMRHIPLKEGRIHHSDHGCQYTSDDYMKKLGNYKLTPSNSGKGRPYENPIAERINGILKHEFNINHEFNTFAAAAAAVRDAIRIYNNERLHTALGYKTPNEVYLQPECAA